MVSRGSGAITPDPHVLSPPPLLPARTRAIVASRNPTFIMQTLTSASNSAPDRQTRLQTVKAAVNEVRHGKESTDV